MSFIKLDRKILSWEWYRDTNTKTVFLHLLLTAAYKPMKYRGIDIEAGQIITTIGELARETGLSDMQIRTSLRHLETTNEITKKVTNRFSLITIVKWADYQGFDPNDNKQITSKQQTDNKQYIYKEVKKLRNKEIIPIYDDSQNPQLDEERLKELMERRLN